MIKIELLKGDCFDLIKGIDDNSVDLVITSPPYADIVNYGKNISIKKSNEYVDWLLPLFNETQRVLKPGGSFILNINDNCSNGLRNPFIYELIYRSQQETKMKFYDTYIWHKMNGIPNGGSKRFRNTTEFIFHFVKDQKKLKFYMDRVLKEPAKATSDRAKYDWSVKNHGDTIDGKRGNKKYVDYSSQLKNGIRPDNVVRFEDTPLVQEKIIQAKKIKYLTGSTNKTKDGYELPTTERTLPDLVRPDNVVRFYTAGHARDNTIKHPAPFYKDLPKYYINLLTDKGDVILDPFGGIMTTGIACVELNRNFIGMELNEKYFDFGMERIKQEQKKHNYTDFFDI